MSSLSPGAQPPRSILNWPNGITLARIFLVGPLVICLLNLNSGWPYWRHLALATFVLMAFSDILDGYLARRMGAETPIGGFLDPVADKLLVTSAVILLAIEQTAVPGYRLPSWVPVIAIGKDLLIVIGFLLLYAATGEFQLQPRRLGKTCTTVQLLLVAYVLVAPSLPAGPAWLLTALSAVASLIAVVTLADYIRAGNRFAVDHPPDGTKGTL
jgi:CDP-diacylglycerol--glycerol-3-phosphate 3-phosphatidyltransferase